jgi:putative radical SAM enzyme (TIGR03279 family)
MRDSLYFKDDDSRLSFLLGNYVTLTNLDAHDIDRIVEMKTSPLHISVHTTNPELRVKMMKNPRAGEIMSLLRRFADANITLECQIVLCRDYNDKEELTRTMQDLASLSPQIESVSIVPCGLTDHRDGLPQLRPFDRESAKEAVKQVEAFAKQCKKRYGKRIFFCGDELYLRAGMKLPRESYYEGYPQLENGVGMMTSMQTELKMALKAGGYPKKIKEKTCSIATGRAAYDYICRLTKAVEKQVKGLHCNVYCIENTFFGKEITVAGLLCGCDLKAQLKNKELGEILYLPEVTLRHEKDLFLDSVSIDEVAEYLQIPIRFVANDGDAFLRALIEG